MATLTKHSASSNLPNLGASVPRCVVGWVAVVALASASFAQARSNTRAHVQTLASEKFDGREAGTPGERMAGDYIAAQLAGLGAKPLPGHRDMFASFEFTAGSKDGGSLIRVENGGPDNGRPIVARAFQDRADI